VSWEGPDVWRDEDGWPPPRLERDVEWWKETHAAGRSSAAVDAVLREHGVYAEPPETSTPPASDAIRAKRSHAREQRRRAAVAMRSS
jgi:FAD/FMN-containing dehydrogenase